MSDTHASSALVPLVSHTFHCTDARSPQTSLPLIALAATRCSTGSSSMLLSSHTCRSRSHNPPGSQLSAAEKVQQLLRVVSSAFDACSAMLQHVAEHIIQDGRPVLDGFECCTKHGLEFFSDVQRSVVQQCFYVAPKCRNPKALSQGSEVARQWDLLLRVKWGSAKQPSTFTCNASLRGMQSTTSDAQHAILIRPTYERTLEFGRESIHCETSGAMTQCRRAGYNHRKVGGVGLGGFGEGIGHWHFSKPTPAFAWSDFGKPWKTLLRMAGLGIEPGSSRTRVTTAPHRRMNLGDNLGQKFSFPYASTWDTAASDSAMTSEGHVRGNTEAAANGQTSEALVYTELWSLAYRSLNSRTFPIPISRVSMCIDIPCLDSDRSRNSIKQVKTGMPTCRRARGARSETAVNRRDGKLDRTAERNAVQTHVAGDIVAFPASTRCHHERHVYAGTRRLVSKGSLLGPRVSKAMAHPITQIVDFTITHVSKAMAHPITQKVDFTITHVSKAMAHPITQIVDFTITLVSKAMAHPITHIVDFTITHVSKAMAHPITQKVDFTVTHVSKAMAHPITQIVDFTITHLSKAMAHPITQKVDFTITHVSKAISHPITQIVDFTITHVSKAMAHPITQKVDFTITHVSKAMAHPITQIVDFTITHVSKAMAHPITQIVDFTITHLSKAMAHPITQIVDFTITHVSKAMAHPITQKVDFTITHVSKAMAHPITQKVDFTITHVSKAMAHPITQIVDFTITHVSKAMAHPITQKVDFTITHVSKAMAHPITQKWLDYSPTIHANRARFPTGSLPDSLHVGIVPDDAAGRRVFSGISRSTRLASPSSALKILTLRAAQISSLTHSPKFESALFHLLHIVMHGRFAFVSSPSPFPPSMRSVVLPKAEKEGGGGGHHTGRVNANPYRLLVLPFQKPTCLRRKPTWSSIVIGRRGGGETMEHGNTFNKFNSLAASGRLSVSFYIPPTRLLHSHRAKLNVERKACTPFQNDIHYPFVGRQQVFHHLQAKAEPKWLPALRAEDYATLAILTNGDRTNMVSLVSHKKNKQQTTSKMETDTSATWHTMREPIWRTLVGNDSIRHPRWRPTPAPPSRRWKNKIVAISTLAPQQGKPASISGRVTPDFRKWKSCRTMPLVGGFSRGSSISPAPSFRRRSMFTSITPIGSKGLDVESRPKSLHSTLHITNFSWTHATHCSR
ncbi:hypothetical protein PR048_024062 [Dryococelus australis]|uniref:Uncharacterized protein n=1 Tax=Dryococelus australis TaxID=614101 RepID=A0ABQ9GVW3_9NEOP|nr:hypothetical protein PR048_024062 [Dryococelus australis]